MVVRAAEIVARRSSFTWGSPVRSRTLPVASARGRLAEICHRFLELRQRVVQAFLQIFVSKRAAHVLEQGLERGHRLREVLQGLAHLRPVLGEGLVQERRGALEVARGQLKVADGTSYPRASLPAHRVQVADEILSSLRRRFQVRHERLAARRRRLQVGGGVLQTLRRGGVAHEPIERVRYARQANHEPLRFGHQLVEAAQQVVCRHGALAL
jgi:hypothetical protein